MSDLLMHSDSGYDSLSERDETLTNIASSSSIDYITASRMVDSYIKVSSISEGSFGVVYRARAKNCANKFHAIKKMKEKYLTNKREGFSHSALREIDILRTCHHKNIVSVIEVCVDTSDEVYMVMEYVLTDIKTWQRSFESASLKMSHIKNLLRQLIAGVAYLHEKSIVHRDLKTSNLLLTADGLLKICDFGLARRIPSDAQKDSSWTPQVMTMLYRSPEVLMRERSLYSKSIDVWSIGIIFAELLLGRPPFVQCMKEPLVPDSFEAEVAMYKELHANLGTPSCLDKFEANAYGHDIIEKAGLDRHSDRSLSQDITGKLSKSGADLLDSMLQWDPRLRLSAQEALNHAFFSELPLPCENTDLQLEHLVNKLDT